MNDEFTTGAVMGLMVGRLESQSEIIRLQAEVIRLQQQVQQMTPSTPADEEMYHIAQGHTSSEITESNDLDELNAYLQWVYNFARKHLTPYVNPKARMEILSHMTRGIPGRIARLQTQQDFAALADKSRSHPALSTRQ